MSRKGFVLIFWVALSAIPREAQSGPSALLLDMPAVIPIQRPIQSSVQTLVGPTYNVSAGVDSPCAPEGILNTCHYVNERIIEKATEYLKTGVASFYNDESIGGKAFRRSGTFARVINLQEPQDQLPIYPACSICPTMFNKEKSEDARAYTGTSCEPRPYANIYPPFFNPNTWSYMQYTGLLTYAISEAAKKVFAQIRAIAEIPKIPVSPGGVEAAMDLAFYTEKTNGFVARLEKDLGPGGISEAKKYFANWDSKISTPGKGPDQGQDRQLAQKLVAFRDSLEAQAAYFVVWTILDEAGEKFQKRVGSWDNFLGPENIAKIHDRVRAKVLAKCGWCKNGKGFSKCLHAWHRCAQREVDRDTPEEMVQYFKATCEVLKSDFKL